GADCVELNCSLRERGRRWNRQRPPPDPFPMKRGHRAISGQNQQSGAVLERSRGAHLGWQGDARPPAMPLGFAESKPGEVLLPKGDPIIAQCFRFGVCDRTKTSPEGTVDTGGSFSAVPSGLTTSSCT